MEMMVYFERKEGWKWVEEEGGRRSPRADVARE
jgi:hypothetical protein